jgi:branched-chain amino acid transport system substrate-binding protein
MRPNRLRKLAAVATAAAVGAALAAAPAGAQSGSTTKTGALVIGNLAPETGTLAALLDSLRKPVQIALDEINAAGGVNGDQVTLVTGDDGADPATVSQTVDRMIATDGANVIIGPASSSTAFDLLDQIKGKALMCSGSNGAAELDRAGPKKSGGLYFRTAPSDTLQGAALSELVLSEGHSKIGVLTRDDAYGVEFGKSFSAAAKQGGARIVADVAYDPNAENLDAEVQKVLAKKPDALVVLGLQDDGAKVVRSLIAQGAGPSTLPIYTANGMQGSDFGVAVDPANPGVVAGIKGTTPASDPAGVESPFGATFAATGVEPIFSAHSYDCTILSALAAVKAKSNDPKKMAKAFAANLRGSEDCNTFAACKDLLERGKTIHWRGASSSFEVFAKNQPAEGVYDIWSYDSAGEVSIEPASSQITIG